MDLLHHHVIQLSKPKIVLCSGRQTILILKKSYNVTECIVFKNVTECMHATNTIRRDTSTGYCPFLGV